MGTPWQFRMSRMRHLPFPNPLVSGHHQKVKHRERGRLMAYPGTEVRFENHRCKQITEEHRHGEKLHLILDFADLTELVGQIYGDRQLEEEERQV